MRKLFCLFAVLFILLSMGCNQRPWNNRVDNLVLECGAADGYSADTTLLLKLSPDPAIADKNDLEVYKVTSASTMEPLRFDLTNKNCLKLNRKDMESAERVGIILKKRQAAEFMSKDFGGTIVEAHLKACGSSCRAFPLCGVVPEVGDERNEKSFFKIQVAEGTPVNAFIEYDFVSKPLEINERQCFSISLSSLGNLKVQDSEGNFFEGSVEQVLAQSARSQFPVETLALRGPLTQQERFCKLNSGYYRMEGAECVPKTYRDFCKDSPWHVGVVALSTFFVRQDCDRGEEFLQTAKVLDFSNKRLTNLEVFSGLKNLKELNLSGNKIQSLNSLLDTSNIEVLKLNLNTTRFDVSSLGRFKNLKVLQLQSTDYINTDQLAVMDSVEELLISRMDVALLRKFPRLKKLKIHTDLDLDVSEIPNDELQSLTIQFANKVSGFPTLKRFRKLAELDLNNIENFEDGGRIPYLPDLTSLSVYNSPFPIIDELTKVETFVDMAVGSPKTLVRNAIPQLRNLKNLTFESYDEVDLGWLACCSNLETLTLRGKFESLDTMPLLPKLRNFDGQQLELKSISGLENLPQLAFLDLTMNSPDLDFSKFPELSKLEEFIYTTIGGLPAQKASVTWLQKVPALRSLTLAINPVDEDLGGILPKDLHSLSLISQTLEDLSFLTKMSSLHSLGLYLKEGVIKDASSINIQPLESLAIDVQAENLSRLPKFGKIDYLLLDTVAWDDKVTEDYVSPLAEKIPEVKEMRISGDVISLKWLERVDKLEILKLDGPFEDFLGLPQLPFLNSLIVASNRFRSLNGIEKLKNLERLEFETLNDLETLKPLSELKNLKELVGPFMRRNFPDVETCPEDSSSPEGLRTYCRALDIPAALSYGPLPY